VRSDGHPRAGRRADGEDQRHGRAATAAAKRPRRWHLYVVKCGDGTYYTGITNDLARRLDQHNRGTASRYTRSRLPVELVHREPCRDKSSALRKECRMKSLARKEKEALFRGTAVPLSAAG
jgi:putative endonuclease